MRETTSPIEAYLNVDGDALLFKKLNNLSKMNNSSDNTPEAAAAEVGPYRDALPTHFTFKINSFSLLTTTSIKKFDSNDFEAGGYKWKLVFYPYGNITTTTTTSSLQNGSSSGNHHVSMYLKIVDTNNLPRGWVIDVSFRFFVLDQIRDKFLILGDMGGRTRKFHEMKTMWGYDQLLPLTSLNDYSSNEYLVDDTCVFGVEVFPCKNTGCGGCLTMVKSPSCVEYTWKIENFSSITEESIDSDVFNAEEYKWKIKVYPKGESRLNNKYFTLYLRLDGMRITDPAAGQLQVYARYKLRLRDLMHNLHKEFVDEKWIIPPGGWGCKLIRLDELNDESKGYLENDTCIVEAEVTVLGAVKKLS